MAKISQISKNILIFAVIATAVFGIYKPTQAIGFNQQINYQGKLTDGAGMAVPDGLYNIEFKLYKTIPPGQEMFLIWTETRFSNGITDNRVKVTNGLFSVMLGSVNSLFGINFNQPLYLGINVGGTGAQPAWDGEMAPRKTLGAVPAAFESTKLNGADWDSPWSIGFVSPQQGQFTNLYATQLLEATDAFIESSTLKKTTIFNGLADTLVIDSGTIKSGVIENLLVSSTTINKSLLVDTMINKGLAQNLDIALANISNATITNGTAANFNLENGLANSLTINGFLNGGVLFTDQAGKITQNNSKFNWNNTLNYLNVDRLTVGNASPNVYNVNILGPGDAQIGISSSDAGGHSWSMQSTGDASGHVGKFQIIDRTAGASRIAISTDGKVGIGTLTPTDNLSIETPVNESASMSLRVKQLGTWRLTVSEFNDLIFSNESDKLPNLTAIIAQLSREKGFTTFMLNAHNLATGGQIQLCANAQGSIGGCASDENLKEDITKIDSAVEKIKQLNGVYYYWKDKERFGTAQETGLLAQDVEKVLPQAVRQTKEYKILNYQSLTGVIVEAIKEQAKSIEEIKNRILTSVGDASSKGAQTIYDFGIAMENGIIKISNLLVEKLTVKQARVETLEMVDKETGEIYCTWIGGGEWKKSKGECGKENKPETDQENNEVIDKLSQPTASSTPVKEPEAKQESPVKEKLATEAETASSTPIAPVVLIEPSVNTPAEPPTSPGHEPLSNNETSPEPAAPPQPAAEPVVPAAEPAPANG